MHCLSTDLLFDYVVKPKRLVLANGDINTIYAFIGKSVTSKPWTLFMIELRDKIEKQMFCTFNYALLNLYHDGSTYISQYKDDESCLNSVFPIAALSLCAQRTIEIRRPNAPSTFIDLEHGSLYSMGKPTNDLFTHGIASDPTIKDMRVSLTYRHLIVLPLDLKKPKLNLDFASLANDPKLKLNLFYVSPLKTEPRDSSTIISSKHISPLNRPEPNVPHKNWFTKMFPEMDAYVPQDWSLRWSSYVKEILENNCSLKVHIRNFKEGASAELFPTKNGIIMTPLTFEHFHQNIVKFNFSTACQLICVKIFLLYKDSALLNFNVFQFVKNLLQNHCTCFYK